VGTQKDAADENPADRVPREQLEAVALERGINFVETSSKTGENVAEAFMQAIRLVWENRSKIPALRKTDDAARDEVEKERKKCSIQ
jgi:GTPase SAR1 family protein